MTGRWDCGEKSALMNARLSVNCSPQCPNFADPYHTLGLVYEADGDVRRSLDFYMIAAHLTPKDVSLWRRLAALSTELGFYR